MSSSPNPNPNPNQIETDDTVNFKKYFYLILANWYWFLMSLFISLSIAWLVNRYTMPVYEVSSSLIINEDYRGKGATAYENMIPGIENYRLQKTVLNEIEMLKSYSLTALALEELNFGITYIGVGRSGIKEALLYHSGPFIVVPDTLMNNQRNYPVYLEILSKKEYEVSINGEFNIRRKVNFGEKFTSAPFNFTIYLKDSTNFSMEKAYNKYYFVINNANSLINNYKNRLTINMNDQKKGSVISLSLVGNSKAQITDYLNNLMEVYIRKGLKEKNQTALNTVNFIDQQLQVLDSALRDAEKNLMEFRLDNRLMDMKSENSMVLDRLAALQKEKTMAKVQGRYLPYLQDYVQDRNNLNQVVVPSISGISDPILSHLVEQLNEELAEKNELLFTVQPGNPGLNIINSKIEDTRNAIQDNLDNLLKNHSIRISEIDKQMSMLDQDFEKLPETERIWINIQRNYKINDEIYTYWLQKRAESAIAMAANIPDNKILDYAKVENAYLISPKKTTNNLRGLLIGLLLPLAILILVDLINNKVVDRTQIEKKTQIPIISSIGHNSTKNDIPVFEVPNSGLAESFRALRTNLQYMLNEKDQKVIAISSTLSGEGKTFCSSNLAAIFAMAGKKTLLVGLDLRKPKIHRIFNLGNAVGISTCLIGKTNLEEIIKESEIENLYIAPSGPIPPNPSELLDGKLMKSIMAEVRRDYDNVIRDTPPIGMVTDSHIISRLCDLSIFIVRQNYSNLRVLDLLDEIYRLDDIGQMGIIMNDISKRGSYGYGYKYYNYGTGYKYGYYNLYENYREKES